jgi:hypothetical protein
MLPEFYPAFAAYLTHYKLPRGAVVTFVWNP